jgi:hypothetical protein
MTQSTPNADGRGGPAPGRAAHPPELVEPEVEGVDDAVAVDDDEAAGGGEAITQPSKLIRIASVVRSLLDEVRRAELDDAGRKLLRDAHERSLAALETVLSDDLREELSDIVLPLEAEVPSESELRIAQAQLVGWLEGLFHGIQATMATQQMLAQQQLDQVRRQAIGPGAGGPGQNRPGGGYI